MSDLGLSLLRVLNKLESSALARRQTGVPVWHIKQQGWLHSSDATVRKGKLEIISAMIAGFQPIFLSHPDDPADDAIPGDWEVAGPSTWVVPRDLDVSGKAIDYWLFTLGNWQMYASPHPVLGDWLDPARTPAAQLVAWMDAHDVTALIDSFHDDVSWVVAVRPGSHDRAMDKGT